MPPVNKHVDHVYIFANDIDRLGGIGRFMNTLGTGFHNQGYRVTLVGMAPVRDRVHFERPAEIEALTLWDDFDVEDWHLTTWRHRMNPARRKRNAKRRELRAGAVSKLREMIAS